MFTGIIEATAYVLQNSPQSIVLDRPALFTDIKTGSSISVSGVCLTVVAFDDASMTFNVVEETLKKSKLGSLKKGDRVNLERAMKADARLDGHVVQGHVEGVGEVESVTLKEESAMMTFHFPLSTIRSVILKGSVAIDGVSLTIAHVEDSHVTVALIPHTLENTTLGSLKEGDKVNIETDVLLRSQAHAQ